MTTAARKPLAFITGATGLLGTHLAKRLLASGFRVRAMVRPSSDVANLKQAGVELFTADITDEPETIRKGLQDVTHVFHCAAFVADWASRQEMVRVNVTGLEHLLQACLGLPIRRIVVVSSLAVYGVGAQIELDESAPLVESGDNYNYTKIESERVAQRFVRDHRLPLVIIRPPYIYGEGDRQFFPRLFEALHDGLFAYLSHGEIPFTLAYAGNVADAMVKAAEADLKPGEDFIITDGHAITRRELVEMICDTVGYQRPTRSFPAWLARLACPVYELKARVLKSRTMPLLNKFRLKFMGTPLTFNIDKAGRLLGYNPPFAPREALKRSIETFRDSHPELLPDGSRATEKGSTG